MASGLVRVRGMVGLFRIVSLFKGQDESNLARVRSTRARSRWNHVKRRAESLPPREHVVAESRLRGRP